MSQGKPCFVETGKGKKMDFPFLLEKDSPFSLKASWKEHKLADTLVLVQGDRCQTSNPQNYKIITFCYFKPLSVCWFIMAVINN